ncbi:MAG: hypothetical protein QOG04_1482 [Actinomycetota bacterium]|jgi:hypothetical protein|nr:hypothetical protein [Actinomycetota bacterium]
MNDESARKAAKNEVISRSLNEGLARGEAKWPSERPTFICECSDLSCTLELTVPIDGYKAVRAHPARFILKPDHVNEEIERVVETFEGYLVVEKIGPGKEVAEQGA